MLSNQESKGKKSFYKKLIYKSPPPDPFVDLDNLDRAQAVILYHTQNLRQIQSSRELVAYLRKLSIQHDIHLEILVARTFEDNLVAFANSDDLLVQNYMLKQKSSSILNAKALVNHILNSSKPEKDFDELDHQLVIDKLSSDSNFDIIAFFNALSILPRVDQSGWILESIISRIDVHRKWSYADDFIFDRIASCRLFKDLTARDILLPPVKLIVLDTNDGGIPSYLVDANDGCQPDLTPGVRASIRSHDRLSILIGLMSDGIRTFIQFYQKALQGRILIGTRGIHEEIASEKHIIDALIEHSGCKTLFNPLLVMLYDWQHSLDRQIYPYDQRIACGEPYLIQSHHYWPRDEEYEFNEEDDGETYELPPPSNSKFSMKLTRIKKLDTCSIKITLTQEDSAIQSCCFKCFVKDAEWLERINSTLLVQRCDKDALLFWYEKGVIDLVKTKENMWIVRESDFLRPKAYLAPVYTALIETPSK